VGAPAVFWLPVSICCGPGPKIIAGAPGQDCAGNNELPPACPWPGAPAVISGPGPDRSSHGQDLSPAHLSSWCAGSRTSSPARRHIGGPALFANGACICWCGGSAISIYRPFPSSGVCSTSSLGIPGMLDGSHANIFQRSRRNSMSTLSYARARSVTC
jgi:hypothetical protein